MTFRFAPLPGAAYVPGSGQAPGPAVPGNYAQNAIMREQLAERNRAAMQGEQLAVRQQDETERGALVDEGLAASQEQRAMQKHQASAIGELMRRARAGDKQAAEMVLRAMGGEIDTEMVTPPPERVMQPQEGGLGGGMSPEQLSQEKPQSSGDFGAMIGGLADLPGASGSPAMTQPPAKESSQVRFGDKVVGEVDLEGEADRGIDNVVNSFKAAFQSDPNIPPGSEAIMNQVAEMAPDMVRAFRNSGVKGDDAQAAKMLLDYARSRIGSLGNVKRKGGGRSGPSTKDVKWLATHQRGLVKDLGLRRNARMVEDGIAQAGKIETAMSGEGSSLLDRQAIAATIKSFTGSRPSEGERGFVVDSGGLFGEGGKLVRIANDIVGEGRSPEVYRDMMREASKLMRAHAEREKQDIIDHTTSIIKASTAHEHILRGNPEEIKKWAWMAALQAGEERTPEVAAKEDAAEAALAGDLAD